jgi:RNA polymerase sigma factor (sigma-70 family)
VHELSDEELLAAIAAGPGFLPEFYRRHVAKVTGVGVRRFSRPEDVADFVANVFLEVMQSAGSYDPRRGNAAAWLYGLAGNVAAGMRRQQQRLTDAEHRLAGRALLDADDYARVEERIDAASALRRAFEAMQQLGDKDRRLLELVAAPGRGVVPGSAASTRAAPARCAGRGCRRGAGGCGRRDRRRLDRPAVRSA